MPNNERLGANFSIDITALKAGLAQANRLIRESESEFKAAAAGMDNWSDSQEGLEASIKNLSNVQDLQRKKVEALKAEYARLVADGLDETSAAAIKLRTDINKEQAALNKTEKELANQTKALEELADSAEDTSGAVKDLGKNAEKSSEGFTVMKGAIANLVSSGIQALVGAAKNAMSSLMGLSESTQEYREDIGKLNTAFEAAGKSTELAKDTYVEFYSVLGEEDRSVEAVNHLAKFVDTEQDMAKWTDICTGVWGTFGDSLPIEGLTEASNETAKVGKLTGVLADALNWAGVNEDDFQASLDKCNGEQERAQLITDTLNGLYSEAAGHYRENNKSVIEARKANSAYTDSLAELGEELEPVQTEVAKLKVELIKGLVPTIKQKIIPAMKTLLKQLKDSGAITVFGEAISFVAKNFKVLTVGIGTAVAAFKTMAIIHTVTTATKGATTAMAALNAVMAANPVGAVVTALVALVAVIGTVATSIKNAKNEYDYMTEAIDENTEANKKWQDTMDNATLELGDFSDFANAAGETTSSLTAKMDEAQAQITNIWATAFAENRQLREDEINAVKQYNEDYIAAQNELALLEQQKLQAQADALQWKIDNMQLSAEEEQAILNKLGEIRASYNTSLSNSVADELVILEQRRINGQITEEEYNAQKEAALAKQQEYAEQEKEITQGVVDSALAAQRERVEINIADYNDRVHTFSSIQEIQEHYNEQIQKLNEDETLSWWDRYWAQQEIRNKMGNESTAFLLGQEVTWTDYNFLIDKSIQENQQAFFNWIANTKEQGGEIDEENKKIAEAIINAYADLPEDLQESGLNSLRGLAEGMADEYPELENAAEMDMEDLISAMNGALGVHSPSTKMKQSGEYVMEGLGNGMNSKLPDIRKTVTNIGNSLIEGFTKLFDIHSPSRVAYGWGDNIVAGLVNGISNNTDNAVKAVREQCEEIEKAYSFDDASTNLTASVNARNANAKKAANKSNADNGGGGVVVYQTNNYSQAHSRYELWKSREQTLAAVKLATGAV